MNFSQDTLALLLVVSTGFLFLVIFASLYYLWKKTEELEFKSRLLGRKPKEVQAGDILGFAGKEIWDFLTSPSTDIERQAEVRKRFVFVLQRHVESIVEQGLFDARKGKVSVPPSEANIGGVSGEVASWLPASYVKDFYEIGSHLKSLEGEADLKKETRLLLSEQLSKVVNELGLEINVDGLVERVAGNIGTFDSDLA